jgi:hypothetical protein
MNLTVMPGYVPPEEKSFSFGGHNFEHCSESEK